jgi:DNA polymerase-3 subunit beta
MTLTLDRDALLASLTRVIGAVDRKATIQVITHVGIFPHPNGVRLMATNLDMQATTTCPARGDIGAFTLPAATLMDILNNWPAGGEVLIERDPADPRIHVKCGRSRFKLPTLDPAHMPVMTAPDGAAVTISVPALATMIDATAYSAGKDQTRFILTGVYVHMDGERVKLAASDNKAVATSWADAKGETGSAILAPAFVSEMARLIQGADAVELTVTDRLSRLVVGDAELIAKVIEGEYVAYTRAFENERPHALTIGREALMGAARRAQIVAIDKDRSVKLHLSSEAVQVTARNQDTGEGDDEIAAEWSGEDMVIRMNGSRLTDALAHMRGDEVVIEVTSPAHPVVIQEADRAVSVGVLRG